jgi:DNA anti-recombination protein RmuC
VRAAASETAADVAIRELQAQVKVATEENKNMKKQFSDLQQNYEQRNDKLQQECNRLSREVDRMRTTAVHQPQPNPCTTSTVQPSFICYNCQQPGHIKRNCPMLLRQTGNQQ